jgi:hypothetical protein
MISPEAVQAALGAYDYCADMDAPAAVPEAMQAALEAAFPIMLREELHVEAVELRKLWVAPVIETVKKGYIKHEHPSCP